MINGLCVVCLPSGQLGVEVTAEGERTQADKNKSRTAKPGITIFLNNMSLPLAGEAAAKKTTEPSFSNSPDWIKKYKVL